jgi:hypothetical protein
VTDATDTGGQLQQEAIHVEKSRKRVGGSLSGRGLTGADVAMENDERVTVAESGDDASTSGMVLLRPTLEAVNISEQPHLPTKPIEPPSEAHEAPSLRLKIAVRQFAPQLKGGGDAHE